MQASEPPIHQKRPAVRENDLYPPHRFDLPLRFNYFVGMKAPDSWAERSARAFNIDPATLEPLIGGNTGADVFKAEFRSRSIVLKIIPSVREALA